MKPMIKNAFMQTRLLLSAMTVASLAATAHAAAPGITSAVLNGQTGTTFNLTAQDSYITQPDGQMIYSWGYGCAAGATVQYAPFNGSCNTMQIPGPTLIVHDGDAVTVTLTNNLPVSAGNTSILFSGIPVQTSCSTNAAGSQQGLLTCEATPGSTVTYTFIAPGPGTRSYYSGTQGDLQVEMGLYGVLIVLPKAANVPSECSTGLPLTNPGANAKAMSHFGETDFRLAPSAYNFVQSCYDREYLFQFSEIDPKIHTQAQKQVQACGPSTTCSLHVQTEPYHPAYFMINGRSMPDDMDANYGVEYPHQPYNGNPHMHPGEMVLLRIVGQGRWQHPFHEHANHVRILGRDGNPILTKDGLALAGPALFTTTTTPGVAMDGIFYYTGRGLNWDMYGHNPASGDPLAKLSCTPDLNGYNTLDSTVNSTTVHAYEQINYFEWCQDHNKPVQATPFGDVPSGGPATLPDPNILVNGAWFGGSPYLGGDATTRATFGNPCTIGQSSGCGTSGTTPPSGTIANNPTSEAGFAFMWHSHNEREITTNNAFPGGMMMMMLVDSREYPIDETY